MFKYTTDDGETVHVVARNDHLLSVVDSNGYLKFIRAPSFKRVSNRFFQLPESTFGNPIPKKEADKNAREYGRFKFSYSVKYSAATGNGIFDNKAKHFKNLKSAVNYTELMLKTYNRVWLVQQVVTNYGYLACESSNYIFCSFSGIEDINCTNISPKTLRKIRKKLSEVSKGINNV